MPKIGAVLSLALNVRDKLGPLKPKLRFLWQPLHSIKFVTKSRKDLGRFFRGMSYTVLSV